MFGQSGIASTDDLQAAGWVLHDINDHQICGLDGFCEGWCPGENYQCSGATEYAAFWCGGGCKGSIELALPAEYNHGRLTLGMSYNNPECHGVVRVGGQIVYDNTGQALTTSVEFDYAAGDTIEISEEATCTVEVYRLDVTTGDWDTITVFGPQGVDSLSALQSNGCLLYTSPSPRD